MAAYCVVTVVDGHTIRPNLGDVPALLANKPRNRSLEFSIDVFGRRILYIADEQISQRRRSSLIAVKEIWPCLSRQDDPQWCADWR